MIAGPNVGVLCGECKDGKGVSALLNRCTTCSNASGILIGLLCEFHSPFSSQYPVTDTHSGVQPGCISFTAGCYETYSILGLPLHLLCTGIDTLQVHCLSIHYIIL